MPLGIFLGSFLLIIIPATINKIDKSTTIIIVDLTNEDGSTPNDILKSST